MAETQLKELLNDFDKAFPDGLSEEDILGKGHSSKLIERAMNSQLIRNINNKYHLNKEGLEMLISLRTKESIDKLDNSIKNFDESSRKFNKGLFWLTLAYTLFSLLIVLKEFFPKLFS